MKAIWKDKAIAKSSNRVAVRGNACSPLVFSGAQQLGDRVDIWRGARGVA